MLRRCSSNIQKIHGVDDRRSIHVGSSLLVAPLFEPGDTRKVYLQQELDRLTKATKLMKVESGTTSQRTDPVICW
jgi:alpha-glucosidase (family GH31 glycosyl hydrolase)